MATTPPPSGGQHPGGHFAALGHKIGPQPMWAWMAEGLGIALGYALYKNHKATAAAAATTSGTGVSTSGEVPADQVPDVIINNELGGPGLSAPTTGPAVPPPAVTPPPASTPPPVSTIGAGAAPAAPGIHEYTGNGKLTLAQVARQHHTTPAAIISSTRKYKKNVSKSLGSYLSAGNFNKPIPKGDTIIY